MSSLSPSPLCYSTRRSANAAASRIPLSRAARPRARLFTVYRTLCLRSLYQESFFQWCFAAEEPDCYGALELATGASILFVPRLPPEYAIWEGKLHTPDDFRRRYGVNEVRYTDEIAGTLKEKRARLLLTLVSLAGNPDADARRPGGGASPYIPFALRGKVLNISYEIRPRDDLSRSPRPCLAGGYRDRFLRRREKSRAIRLA